MPFYLIFFLKRCILDCVVKWMEGCLLNSSIIYFYINILAQGLMTLIAVYFFIILIAGWNQRKKDQIKIHDPQKSFALIVAAHNEENVISYVIESLKKLEYPKELYDIFVIADNCTDGTSTVASKAGALVHERTDTTLKGKGYALAWMFDRIFKMDKKYDAVAVFDADNLVSSNFLSSMNNMLCDGHKAIQAYLDIKNPYDSWVTLTNSIMYWITNKMFNQTRHNLNMWCTIGGTGFCLDIEVLKQIPWDATCLAEDLEYTVKLVLNDIRVSWCGDASIYDEKPITFMQSWNQRKRWMQGHIDVFSRFFLKLLKKGIKERKLTPIDLALYNFQPLNIVLTSFVSVILYLVMYIPDLHIQSFSVKQVIDMKLLEPWAMYTVIGFLKVFPTFFIYLLPTLILILEKRFNSRVIFGLLWFPIFAITWIPIIILGVINRNKKEWNHTVHTRQITIKELEET